MWWSGSVGAAKIQAVQVQVRVRNVQMQNLKRETGTSILFILHGPLALLTPLALLIPLLLWSFCSPDSYPIPTSARSCSTQTFASPKLPAASDPFSTSEIASDAHQVGSASASAAELRSHRRILAPGLTERTVKKGDTVESGDTVEKEEKLQRGDTVERRGTVERGDMVKGDMSRNEKLVVIREEKKTCQCNWAQLGGINVHLSDTFRSPPLYFRIGFRSNQLHFPLAMLCTKVKAYNTDHFVYRMVDTVKKMTWSRGETWFRGQTVGMVEGEAKSKEEIRSKKWHGWEGRHGQEGRRSRGKTRSREETRSTLVWGQLYETLYERQCMIVLVWGTPVWGALVLWKW